MQQPQMNPYKAYRNASHTVNKTRQVVMIYDGAIRFLQQAADAIEQKDYEARYNKLIRVSDIITGLQACLDFQAGGNPAKILYDFYSSVDARIFALHRTNDIEACRAIIADMKQMRDVWSAIDSGMDEPPMEVRTENIAIPSTDSITVSA
jgi:flagellar protein FliS